MVKLSFKVTIFIITFPRPFIRITLLHLTPTKYKDFMKILQITFLWMMNDDRPCLYVD